MQKIATVSERTASLHGHVPGNLLHPPLVRVNGNAGDVGPGLLANEMATLVGSNGHVCGIDISEDMLTMSRKRCADQSWTEFKKADATNLPFPDQTFDAAVSTQVYEYAADIPHALAELYRVTRHGGRVVILDSDYRSLIIH